MTHDPDRRRAPRVPFHAIASLLTSAGLNTNDQGLCVVKNVSRTGIGIETGQPPVRGQLVILRLALGDTLHVLRTHAVRVKRRGTSDFYEVGLDWSKLPSAQLEFLEHVLRTVDGVPSA